MDKPVCETFQSLMQPRYGQWSGRLSPSGPGWAFGRGQGVCAEATGDQRKVEGSGPTEGAASAQTSRPGEGPQPAPSEGGGDTLLDRGQAAVLGRVDGLLWGDRTQSWAWTTEV